ncbi:MAG: hypothetical protein C4527_04695 [Candidatus Omnitrophota bacterium]|jgi:hypothetical protein|nr:MAG: hypothetical protein C4527_04695 [Candidatus Omnitrophota bacterium]
MQGINWTSFDKLFHIVSSAEGITDRRFDLNQHDLFSNLTEKRDELEQQYHRFLQSDEGDILEEYERLQQIHSELMDCYKQIPHKKQYA